MRAMILDRPGAALRLADIPRPEARAGEIVIEVKACGVCRTDLHIVDGDLPPRGHRIVPGHEVVGQVVELGDGVTSLSSATASACPGSATPAAIAPIAFPVGENLCDEPGFTGYDIDGGYAEYARASADFCFPIPDGYGDVEAAPLLCAGLIGYRSFAMAGEGSALGLYGFGAAAHIIAQLAAAKGRRVLRLHAAGRRQGTGLRAPARRRLGRLVGRAAARGSSTPRSCSPRSARWCRRR